MDVGKTSHDVALRVHDTSAPSQHVFSLARDVRQAPSDVSALAPDVGPRASDGFPLADALGRAESGRSRVAHDGGVTQSVGSPLAHARAESETVVFGDFHGVGMSFSVVESDTLVGGTSRRVAEPSAHVESPLNATHGIDRHDGFVRREGSCAQLPALSSVAAASSRRRASE